MKPREQTKKKLIVAVVVIISVALIGWLGYTWWQSTTVNYAQEVARPIEEALVRAGAVKMCSNGDAGRGPDNREPNYTLVFETSLSKKDAAKLIKQVSSDDGYSLVEAPSAYSEIASYYDHNSRRNLNSSLKDGPILLGISLYDGGNNLSCAKTKVRYDTDHAAIKVDVSLPAYK